MAWWPACSNTLLQDLFDGGLRNRVPSHAGYENLEPIAKLPADGGPEAHMLGPAKGDGKLTFDKLTDLYHSGTKHEEDQPAHLLIQDTNICNDRCVKEFGSPLPEFLSGERLRNGGRCRRAQRQRISLNPANCVHCKTCDIQDPIRSLRGLRPRAAAGRVMTGCNILG